MPEREHARIGTRARGLLLFFGLAGFLFYHSRLVADPPGTLDPAAWGGDHVGKPVPEYVDGNECLFCHRNDVGPTWNDNRHARSVRDIAADSPALAALLASPALKQAAGEVPLVMGESHHQRFLRPAAAFGQLELFSSGWQPPEAGTAGRLVATEQPRWDTKTFGDACAGCHSTGVDSLQRTFFTRSLDCGVCHGEVPNDHTKNAALVHLSPRRKDPARVTTSICAQCHVRTGTAKSTGLPYANNFVPGDNLFRDFQADLSDAAIARLDPGDAHVLANVRDVVLLGKEKVTCLSCHDIHKQSTRKHHVLPQSARCLTCHNETGTKKERKPYAVHSRTCGY